MRRLVRASLAVILASCQSEPVDRGPPSPAQPVEIRVDTLGISHVYAASEEDAMFGAGYAMARDRLFQMEINRRRAQGRYAEIFGSSKLKDDIGARTFGFMRLGAADVARMRRERPADAKLLDAWARGINLRLHEIRTGVAKRPYGLGTGAEELDFVPDDWSAEDGAAVGKLLGFGLSSTLDSEVLATAVLSLSPEFGAQYPLLMPAYDVFPMRAGTAKSIASPPSFVPSPLAGTRPTQVSSWSVFGDSQGSNNWAVAGAHTDNGRPYLAGDPHQTLGSPIRLWPFHMTGGGFDVIGFSFAGTPSVELGHNARVGWTATTAFADVMDLLGVALDDDEANVIVGSERLPLVTRKELIRIKGGSEQELIVREVPGKGVIFPKEILPVPALFLTKSPEILFLWTGFQPTLEGSAYLAMDRAQNVDEWERAVDLIDVGAQNFVAADAKDISYHVSLKLPDRGPPSARPMPWRLLPGESVDQLWMRGYIDPSKLPRERSPARGYIATANTDPFGFTEDGNVENDSFYYGAFFANGMRLHGIERGLSELLGRGKKIDRSDMEALQRDKRSPMADVIVDKLKSAWARAQTEPSLATFKRPELGLLVDRLATWDRAMAAASGDAVVALGIEWFAARDVIEPRLGELLFEGIAEKSPPFVLGALRNVLDGRFAAANSFLPPGGGDEVLLRALAETHAWLVERFGAADPTKFALQDLLAAEFPTSFGHRLEVGRTPIGGSFDTIDVAPAPFFQKKGAEFVPLRELACTEMAMYRMVIGFDDDGVPRATFDFARGTREDPSDPHFGDRNAEWAASQHGALWFRRADVEAHTEERLVLGR